MYLSTQNSKVKLGGLYFISEATSRSETNEKNLFDPTCHLTSFKAEENEPMMY